MQSTLRDEEGNVLYRATLTYDAQNRLETFRERVGEEHHKTAFTYDKDSRVTRMDYDTDKGKVEYAFTFPPFPYCTSSSSPLRSSL